MVEILSDSTDGWAGNGWIETLARKPFRRPGVIACQQHPARDVGAVEEDEVSAFRKL
ncbi:hypothetical protein GW781_01735 [bacterium]|nr:hypothetical protein [bacterium]NCT19857.1 hypothetical protein [bacterium]